MVLTVTRVERWKESVGAMACALGIVNSEVCQRAATAWHASTSRT